MSLYTLVYRKEYDVDKLPKGVFDRLEEKFPAHQSESDFGGSYTFKPYRVDIVGVERKISTTAKEVQDFLDQELEQGTKLITGDSLDNVIAGAKKQAQEQRGGVGENMMRSYGSAAHPQPVGVGADMVRSHGSVADKML